MAIPFHDKRIGEVLYHGTNAELSPGDVIKPAVEVGHSRHREVPFGPSQHEPYYQAHAAPEEHYGKQMADLYAGYAAHRRGGKPRVYQVTPVDKNEVETKHRTRVSRKGFKVVKELRHDPTQQIWRDNGKYHPEHYGK